MPRRFYSQKSASSIGEIFFWDDDEKKDATDEPKEEPPVEEPPPPPTTTTTALPPTQEPKRKKPPPKKKKKKKTEDKKRAPFHLYGNSNVEPHSGGVVYGQYMLSHNARAYDPDGQYLQVYPAVLRVKNIETMLKPNDDLNPGVTAEIAAQAKYMPPPPQQKKQKILPRNDIKVNLLCRLTSYSSSQESPPVAPPVAPTLPVHDGPPPPKIAGIRYDRGGTVGDCLVFG